MSSPDVLFKQLRRNTAGSIHYVAPLLVVLVVAIVGAYLLVKGHALSVNPVAKQYAQSQLAIQHAPAGSVDRIVKTAEQQLGYAEQPVNKVKFFEWAGDKPGQPGPWCAVFVSWVWHAAGVRAEKGAPYPLRPAVVSVLQDGISHHRFSKASPHAGYAIIYGNPNSPANMHIGIVERVVGRKIQVIEGNADLTGPNDRHVIRRSIDLAHPVNIPHGVIWGYVAPPKAVVF